MRTKIAMLSLMLLWGAQLAGAQASKPAPATAADKSANAKSAPDVIVFTNGDQLTGKLVSAAGGNVVFKSDMAGQLTIPFDKIKQLRSGEEFAVLRKGKPVDKSKTIEPVGSIEVADKDVKVTPPGQPATLAPAADVAYLVDKATYDQEMNRKAAFLSGWKGAVTGGATLVRSTTAETSLTAGITLVRAIPDVAWMEARNRTTFDLTETYGKNTSPGAIPQTTPPTPSVTTLSSIFHSDAERDEYFKPTVYALGDLAFDHDYAQGLALQQIYGGGAGWTVIRDPRQEFDLKVDLHYERQEFITAPVNGTTVATVPSKDLIGSSLFESYHRILPRKVVLTETGTYIPAFNELYAYSGNFTVALSLPILKRLSATISSTDDYLNDPSPGYRKNSLQFVTGVTYTLP